MSNDIKIIPATTVAPTQGQYSKEQFVSHEALFAWAFAPDVNYPIDLHAHNWDHVTLIPPGSVFDVVVADQVTRAEGLCFVVIAAGQRHTFISRKENSVHVCMQVLRNKDDWTTIVDVAVIPAGSKFDFKDYAPTFGGVPPEKNFEEEMAKRKKNDFLGPVYLPGSPEPTNETK